MACFLPWGKAARFASYTFTASLLSGIFMFSLNLNIVELSNGDGQGDSCPQAAHCTFCSFPELSPLSQRFPEMNDEFYGWPLLSLSHLRLLAFCPTVSCGCSSHDTVGLWGLHMIHGIFTHPCHVKHWCAGCLLLLFLLSLGFRCSSYFSLGILCLRNFKQNPWGTCEAFLRTFLPSSLLMSVPTWASWTSGAQQAVIRKGRCQSPFLIGIPMPISNFLSRWKEREKRNQSALPLCLQLLSYSMNF